MKCTTFYTDPRAIEIIREHEVNRRDALLCAFLDMPNRRVRKVQVNICYCIPSYVHSTVAVKKKYLGEDVSCTMFLGVKQ